MENVDDDGHPVPDGAPGARLLVTSLANRVQPLIRLELSDAMTLTRSRAPAGARCGAIRSIEGRADDVLWLPGAGGARRGPPHAVLRRRPRPRRRRVPGRAGGRAPASLVVGRGAAPGLETRLRTAVEQRLRDVGVAEPADRRSNAVPALARQPGGKLQIVVADRGARQPVAL